MLRFPCSVLGVVIFAGCLSAFQLSADDTFRETTVCQVVKNREAYAGKRIRLRAFLLSNVKYSSHLSDRACNSAGINVADGEWKGRPISLVKDGSYKRFETLRPKAIELYEKQRYIYGTFEGVFEAESLHTPNVALPAMTLVLHRISAVQVGEQDDGKDLR